MLWREATGRVKAQQGVEGETALGTDTIASLIKSISGVEVLYKSVASLFPYGPRKTSNGLERLAL